MRACPFCGCLNSTTVFDTMHWYVSCDGCMARGPRATNRAQAEMYWNRIKTGSNPVGRPITYISDKYNTDKRV